MGLENSDGFPTIDKSLGTTPDQVFNGVIKANELLKSNANTSFIQKRGFTYTGDSSNLWGTRDTNFSYNGGWSFQNREISFSLQPFGLGVNSLLGPAGITPSIFSMTGPGANYSKHTKVAHLKMALAVEAYKGFGVVKNVIDLMCNFASEDMKIIHPRPAIQKFYRRWAQAVDLQGRVKDIFREYYKYSNVFVYKTYGEIDDITYRKMKTSTRAAKDADVVDTNDPVFDLRINREETEKSKPLGKRKIPWRYTLLNPLQMDLKGSKYFGESRWVFVLDPDTKKKIEDSSGFTPEMADDTKINLPPDFKRTKDGIIVELNPTQLYVLHYMKDDHEDWADPMVWPVMNDIMYKNQLRAMDMSVANSVINAITIIKLGNIDKGYQPPAAHFAKLAEMLRTPTYSHTFVWNDAISMESMYPPVEKILSIEKYKSVDRDILAGLGVPAILVDGSEGGNFSNAYLQVRTLLERLEEGRNEVLKWLDRELREIANVMGHRDIPTIKFGNMSLKDENAEKQMIVQLLDRNIISAERVHEVFDIETNIEIERLRNEMKLAEQEDIFVKFGPYKDPMNMLDTEQVMELDFKQKKALEKEKVANKPAPTSSPFGQPKTINRPNGRPAGTGKPQQKSRKPKPRGMGELSVAAHNIFNAVETKLTSMLVKAKGMRHQKQLELKDKESIAELIFYTAMSISPDTEVNDSTIALAMQNLSIDDYLHDKFKECASINRISGRRQHRIATYVEMWGDLNEEE